MSNKETITLSLIIGIVIVGLTLVGYITYQVVGVVTQDSLKGKPLDGNNLNQEGNQTIYECGDNIDNDGDGFIDLLDFGCSSATDNSEINNGQYACSDGIDNDHDGSIDQADVGCDSWNDNSEGTVVLNLTCDLTSASWNVTSANFGDLINLRVNGNHCGGNLYDITVYENLDNDTLIDKKTGLNFTGNSSFVDWRFNDGSGSSGFNFILPVVINLSLGAFVFGFRRFGGNKSLVIGILIVVVIIFSLLGSSFYQHSLVSFSPGDREFYFIANLTNGTDSVRSDTLHIYNYSACEDGNDNDGDGLVDESDPGCWDSGEYSSSDNLENDTLAVCSNFFDDDNDGYADLLDFGCVNATDSSELNNGTTQCSNGLDDDNDGSIDQADSGCMNYSDNSESDLVCTGNETQQCVYTLGSSTANGTQTCLNGQFGACGCYVDIDQNGIFDAQDYQSNYFNASCNAGNMRYDCDGNGILECSFNSSYAGPDLVCFGAVVQHYSSSGECDCRQSNGDGTYNTDSC